MIRGAIFDLDGVLLDSMGIWEGLGARYLRRLRITPEPGLNEILFPMSMEQGAAYLKARYPLQQSEAEICCGIAQMLEDYYVREVPAKPGAAALSTVGVAHLLAVDWLGWVWYLGKFLILIYFYRNKV